MNDSFINTLDVGTVLKGNTYRYEILEVLGQGAFGIAYKAEMYYQTQDETGKLVERSCPVAVKEFFMKKLNGREGSSVTTRSSQKTVTHYKAEFEHEAANLRFMIHPHIVKVHELFYANDTIYYSMELLDKRTLDDIIKEKGKLSLTESLKFLQEIGSALSCMHDYKMLHLDLKPSNIMINSEGEAVLIDFGLSKRYSQDGKSETDSNIGKGTRGYAPIEQFDQSVGSDFAETMDIYALGATLFKMLTGQRPPEAISIASDGFPAFILQEANVDESVMPAIAKAMNPEKSKRYQTVDDFIKACLPEPDCEKADELERLAENAKGLERINLLKAAYHADPTRLSVVKALDGHYIDGDIIEKDLTQSAEWCLKAAKLGDNESQRDIADMYSCGDGLPQNDYLAVKWYRISAEGGNPYSCMFLADKYYNGQGVPQDYTEAIYWYEKSISWQKDNTGALYSLGYMYENGLGVDVNYDYAIELYRRVADSHGDNVSTKTLDTVVRIPECMFRLGQIYQYGEKEYKDYQKAIHYYQKAIKYDHADALFYLGTMAFNGQGMNENKALALELWTKAANVKVYDNDPITVGGLSSMYNLGVCYEMGYGCRIDYENAKSWYHKALEWGYDGAKLAIEKLDAKILEQEKKKSNGFWNKVKSFFVS